MKNKERSLWIIAIVIFVAATLAWAGTFTSYNDISALQDADELLLYDDSEGSGDQLANMTIANFRATLGALFSGDIDAGAFSADAIVTTDIATDAVTMDAVDADGAFTSLTGAWATTGELSGAVPAATKTSAYTVAGVYCFGGVIYVSSAAIITACDDLASGMAFTVITIGATAVSVDTQSDDLMNLDGVPLDDGDKATNTSTAGDSIVCTYYDATGWYCMSGSPDGDNWTDGGA